MDTFISEFELTFETSLLLAIPFFGVLMAIEFIATKLLKRDYYDNLPDVNSSLSSGLCNAAIRTTGIGFAIITYKALYENFAVFDFNNLNSFWVWLACLICLDFAGYWGHRFNHKYNVLWQLHLVHHSSEEYNMPVALRQPTNGFISLFTFLLIPAAFLGISPETLALVGLFHLYAQYWYHTRFFGKLGILEYILVTPSQHRVHHALNREYIDKNFSNVFCVWDRLFGTFQEEDLSQETKFGITYPVNTLNPVKIDFFFFADLLKSSIRTKNIKDKFLVWIKPTNWRPEDIRRDYVKNRIRNIETYQKYAPKSTIGMKFWAGIEFNLTVVWMIAMVFLIPNMSYAQHLFAALFLVLHVMTYTTLLEGERKMHWPIARFIAVLALIQYQGGSWFGAEEYFEYTAQFVTGYFALGILTAYFFTSQHKELSAINKPSTGTQQTI